jgi:hypothetical protein
MKVLQSQFFFLKKGCLLISNNFQNNLMWQIILILFIDEELCILPKVLQVSVRVGIWAEII